MKYFGTDGIRDNCERILFLAHPLGVVLGERNSLVMVGRDTRPSSFDIEKELVGGLLSKGAKVGLVGVVPTPTLCREGVKRKCTCVMITASHNPPQYNGLKVMGADGKLAEEEELYLDLALDRELSFPSHPNEDGKVEVLSGVSREYKRHVISAFGHLDLSKLGKKIYIDTAHGCFSYLAKDIIESLGGDVIALNNDYEGANVNVKCGALYVSDFAKKIPHESIGFAFDGDGDRVLTVLNGKVYDGDLMLYAIAQNYKGKGKTINSVVGTIMTGGGVEKALKKDKIDLVRTDVGDKHVLELMKRRNLLLGGEKSGHLIVYDKTATGDGIVTALSFLDSYVNGNVKKIKEYPMKNFGLETENPRDLYDTDLFQMKISKAKEEIGDKGRLIVRPSGTENVIRISVEIYDRRLECEKIIEKNFFSKNLQKME